MERLALLAVTAHPGDELAFAGTLARYAQAGVYVALACATRGEVARHPDPRPPEERAAGRERDLRCACERLGVAQVHLLGYRDSGPCGDESSADALARAEVCEAVRRIVGLVRRVRPQVMVTFGPDGIDGQIDHVAIGRLASEAFGAAGDVEQFPVDGGPASFMPAKLYHFGLPDGLLRLAAIPSKGTPEEAIAAREDVSLFVDRKLDAARCYGVDLEPYLGKLLQLPEPERHHLLRVEFFSLAQPQPGVDDRRDPHLFAGIPERAAERAPMPYPERSGGPALPAHAAERAPTPALPAHAAERAPMPRPERSGGPALPAHAAERAPTPALPLGYSPDRLLEVLPVAWTLLTQRQTALSDQA